MRGYIREHNTSAVHMMIYSTPATGEGVFVKTVRDAAVAGFTCRASSTIWANVTSSRDARRLVPKRSARRAPSPADPVRPTLESTHRPLARSCEQAAPALSEKWWVSLSMSSARLSASGQPHREGQLKHGFRRAILQSETLGDTKSSVVAVSLACALLMMPDVNTSSAVRPFSLAS